MAKIIAIVLVMVVINAFLIYAVIKAWERTNDKVNKYFLDRSSDFYADKKEKTIAKQDKPVEKTVIVNQKPLFVYDSKVDSSSYKDKEFNTKYKNVKEHLDFNKKDVINDVIKQNDDIGISIESFALKINEEFSFETIYELSTLASSEQIDLLKSCFDLTEIQLLDQYILKSNKRFNVIDFFGYINTIAKENDPNFYVKTGTRKDNFDKIDDKVKTVYDKNITEGIKIVHKDKMYDYSI